MRYKNNVLIRTVALLLAMLMLPVMPITATATEAYAANEKLVLTVNEFTLALQDKTINTVYLGADIEMQSNITNIPNRTGGLTIIGHPKDDISTRYTYTDYSSRHTRTSLAGELNQITFFQIKMNIRNYFGVYRQTSDNVTITFHEVNGQASQWVYGSQSKTNVVIHDSNLNLVYNGGNNGELVEGAANIIFKGDVTVKKTNTEQMFKSIGEIIFDKSSNVKLYSSNGFCYNIVKQVLVENDADVQFIYTGASTNSYPLYTNELTINKGASLLIYHDGSTAYNALIAEKINIDNPKRVVVINKNGNAISNYRTPSLYAVDIQSIRYFDNAQLAEIYDTTSNSYIANMETASKISWAQTELFDISIDSWINGKTITTNYTNLKIPEDNRSYAATLNEGNFTVNNQKPYAIEIRGEDYAASETTLIAEYARTKVYNDETLSLTAINPNSGAQQSIVSVRWLRESVLSQANYLSFDDFNAAYDAANAEHKGTDGADQFHFIKGDKKNNATYQMNVTNNGTYWAEVTYTFGDLGTVHRDYVKIVVDNIYTKQIISTRGIYNDTMLYPYTAPSGKNVGIPYDLQGDILNDPPLGFDSYRFTIDDRYATHWQASMSNDQPVPNTIELNQSFQSNTLCDNSNPLQYTLNYSHAPNWWTNITVNYVTQDGDSLSFDNSSTGSLSVPLDQENGNTASNYSQFGDSYTPPSNDIYSPIGYYVGIGFDRNNYIELTSFVDFNPQFTDTGNQQLYIVYTTGLVTVTERFIIKGDSEMNDIELNSNTVTLATTENYKAYPKNISGYVETGYEIQNTVNANEVYSFVYDDKANPAGSQNGLFEVSIAASDIRDDTVVIYYYEREIKTGTGIPASQAIVLNIKHLGNKLGDESDYVIDERIEYTRKNLETTYTNDGLDGNSNHTITIANDSGQWLFDTSEQQPTSITITPSADTTISFHYLYDSLKNGTPDREQYVIEQYRLDGDRDIVLSADTISYALKGASYIKQAPKIINYNNKVYHAYAYQVDSNTETLGDTASFTTENEQHTVSFLYHEQETLSVIYQGDISLTGLIELGRDTITGYYGKDITAEVKTALERAFSGFVFEKAMLGDATINLNDLQTITLNAKEERTLTIFYKQTALPSTITIQGVAGERGETTLYSYQTQISPLAENQIIKAISMPGYSVSEVSLDDYRESGVTSITVDPAKGDQTVTFTYIPTSTQITICAVAYDDINNNLITPIVTTAAIGNEFFYQSPAVEGYTLTDKQGNNIVPFTEKLTNVAADENSEIIFYYKKATGNQRVILRDGVTGAVIGLESYAVAAKELSTIPVTELDFYTTDEKAKTFTWDGVSRISDITYTYQRNALPIQLIAYDTKTEMPIAGASIETDAKRVLEAYDYSSDILNLLAKVGDKYSLVPSSSTSFIVQKDAAQNIVQVWFEPMENDKVTVEVWSQSDLLLPDLLLLRYRIPVAENDTISLTANDAPTIAGYTLVQEDENSYTAQAGGTIKFLMKDVRHTITVNSTVADNTNEIESYRVIHGESVTIYVPYIPGYTLESYQVDEDDKVIAANDLSYILLEGIIKDSNISFIYKPVEQFINELYSTITVVGTVDGSTQYSYTKRMSKNAGNQIIEAIEIPGYYVSKVTLGERPMDTDTSVTVDPANGDQTVSFHYTTTTTQVTIRAVEYNQKDNNLITPIVMSATIGSEFIYRSPAVEGYTLTDETGNNISPFTASLTKVDAAGTSEIIFYYKKATGNQSVVLRDNDTHEIIGYESYQITAKEEYTVQVTPLTYYTANNLPIKQTWDGVSPISDITFYYTRNTAAITLVAYDTRTGYPIEGARYSTPSLRVKDAYDYSADISALEAKIESNYSLVPINNTSFVVQQDAIANEVKVWFNPKQKDAIVVEARTQNNVLLQSYTLPAVANEIIELSAEHAPSIAGYSLVENLSTFKAKAGDTITFVMQDVRHTITVKTVADSTNEEAASYRVIHGEDVNVNVPYIPGYTLESYQIDEEAEVKVENPFSFIPLEDVTNDQVVSYHYKTVEQSVNEEYSTITIIGMSEGNQQYSYTKRINKTAGNQSIEAFTIPGYTVSEAMLEETPMGAKTIVNVNPASGDQTVTFTYESIFRSVTVIMQNEEQTRLDSFEVQASIGDAFTYHAPAIENYYLVSASVDGVQSNDSYIASLEEVKESNNTITFVYAKIQNGQSVMVLKEEDILIQNILVDTSQFIENEVQNIPAPDLSEQFYTIDGENSVSIKWNSNKAFVIEFNYKKQTQDVKLNSYDVMDMNTPLKSEILNDQRMGETIHVQAQTIDGYTLLSKNELAVTVTQEDVCFYYIKQDSGYGTIQLSAANANTEIPLSHASVSLTPLISGKTDEAGVCNFTDIPYGSYELTLTSDGYHDGKVTVTISEEKPHATVYMSLSQPSKGGGSSEISTIYYALVFDTKGGNAISAITKLNGTSIDLSSYKPMKAGYEFTGWYANESLTEKISSVRLTDNLIVYAGWLEAEEVEKDIEATALTKHEPYVSGYADNSFRPDESIKRAELAQLLYNISGKKGAGADRFSDVVQGSWYYAAVTALTEQGVILGYEDGTFKPGNDVTRAEFVALVARYMGLSASNNQSFTDVATNHWAAGYITAATQAGYLSGYPDGTFRPDQSITRAEAVKILNAMLGRKADANSLAKYAMPFNDVFTNHWAYYEILEASVSHEA